MGKRDDRDTLEIVGDIIGMTRDGADWMRKLTHGTRTWRERKREVVGIMMTRSLWTVSATVFFKGGSEGAFDFGFGIGPDENITPPIEFSMRFARLPKRKRERLARLAERTMGKWIREIGNDKS